MAWGRTNRLIIAAAERLGVDAAPVSEAAHTDFLMRLSPRGGGPSVIISKTRSPFLTQVAQTLSNNKLVSRERLAAHGVPIVECVMVDDDQDPRAPRVAAFLARHGAVIVKPNWGNRARGLSGPHRTLDAVVRACAWAQDCDRDCEALVERYVPGTNLRVTVIGGRAVAAAEIQRPILEGGARSFGEQLAALNRDPRRARAPEDLLGLDVMPAGELIAPMLEVHGLALSSAPPAGATVELYSEEREIIDRTDELHPEWGAMAERACSLLGVDVGGVDLRGPLAAFTRPPSAGAGVVLLEVNVLPALHLHALPTRGAPRPVFEAFVAYCLSLPGAPPPCAVVGA